MSFPTESAGYQKTVLLDLQGAWEVLRQSVVDSAGFEGWERAIFHIDEAMSWETVRNLERMPPLLLIVRNLCLTGKAPEEVIENIEDVEDILVEVQKYKKQSIAVRNYNNEAATASDNYS